MSDRDGLTPNPFDTPFSPPTPSGNPFDTPFASETTSLFSADSFPVTSGSPHLLSSDSTANPFQPSGETRSLSAFDSGNPFSSPYTSLFGEPSSDSASPSPLRSPSPLPSFSPSPAPPPPSSLFPSALPTSSSSSSLSTFPTSHSYQSSPAQSSPPPSFLLQSSDLRDSQELVFFGEHQPRKEGEVKSKRSLCTFSSDSDEGERGSEREGGRGLSETTAVVDDRRERAMKGLLMLDRMGAMRLSLPHHSISHTRYLQFYSSSFLLYFHLTFANSPSPPQGPKDRST